MKMSELPYPERFPHLVVGGRFSMDSGSVSWDMAKELEAAFPTTTLRVFEELRDAETLQDIAETLEWMFNNNLNFVGSRGFVYSSLSMLGYIKAIARGEEVYPPYLTRTLGLRQRAIELQRR